MQLFESRPAANNGMFTATAMLKRSPSLEKPRSVSSAPVRISTTLQFQDGAKSDLQPAVFSVPRDKVFQIDYVSLQGTLPSDQSMWLLLGLPGVPLAYVEVTSQPISASEYLQIASKALNLLLAGGEVLALGARRTGTGQQSSPLNIVITGRLLDEKAQY